MKRLKPGMSNVEIALDRNWVEDKTDYIVSLYHKHASHLRRAQVLERKYYASLYPYHAFFGDVEGEFLYLSMREMQPEVVVDIGVGGGFSTSWLLQGIVDNRHGHLTSCDILYEGPPYIRKHFNPVSLEECWTFLHGDSADQVFPDEIDFLLSDSSHDGPYSKVFNDIMIPKMRPGGRVCVHDVFMLMTPAHGEATETFVWLDKLGIQCYTVANCFVEQHAKIQQARKDIGLGPDMHVNLGDSLLIFDVPNNV